MMPGHSEDFVQERAPGILKPTLVTGYAEGLTGKSTAKDFMIRHLGGFHFGQVARGTFVIVLQVGKLGVLVPIGGKHTGTSTILESLAEATDSTKQINESHARFPNFPPYPRGSLNGSGNQPERASIGSDVAKFDCFGQSLKRIPGGNELLAHEAFILSLIHI